MGECRCRRWIIQPRRSGGRPRGAAVYCRLRRHHRGSAGESAPLLCASPLWRISGTSIASPMMRRGGFYSRQSRSCRSHSVASSCSVMRATLETGTRHEVLNTRHHCGWHKNTNLRILYRVYCITRKKAIKSNCFAVSKRSKCSLDERMNWNRGACCWTSALRHWLQAVGVGALASQRCLWRVSQHRWPAHRQPQSAPRRGGRFGSASSPGLRTAVRRNARRISRSSICRPSATPPP